MVNSYYIDADRFRLVGLDDRARDTVVELWRKLGGVVENGPVGSLDLTEGSQSRFGKFAEETDDEISRSVKSRLQGHSVTSWELPLAGGERIEIGSKPIIMGVVNITPDSFSDGGKFFDTNRAFEQGKSLADEGADILDIGGESTRPGSDPVDIDEECRRTIPVIERLVAAVDIPVSIDTRKPEVAKRALDAGAKFINDATMLTHDPELASVAAEAGCALVLNHIKGTPKDMQQDPHYDDLWPEIVDTLENAASKALDRGVDENSLVLDPGIGFGKTLDHNLRILKGLRALTACGKPVLIGPSRKRFIDAVLHLPPEERLEGTIAACVAALLGGASIFRVHDVLPHRRALDLAWAIHRSA